MSMVNHMLTPKGNKSVLLGGRRVCASALDAVWKGLVCIVFAARVGKSVWGNAESIAQTRDGAYREGLWESG